MAGALVPWTWSALDLALLDRTLVLWGFDLVVSTFWSRFEADKPGLLVLPLKCYLMSLNLNPKRLVCPAAELVGVLLGQEGSSDSSGEENPDSLTESDAETCCRCLGPVPSGRGPVPPGLGRAPQNAAPSPLHPRWKFVWCL